MNLYQAISSARQINCPPTNIAWYIIGFIQRDKQGLKGDEDCLISYGLGDPLSLLSKECRFDSTIASSNRHLSSNQRSSKNGRKSTFASKTPKETSVLVIKIHFRFTNHLTKIKPTPFTFASRWFSRTHLSKTCILVIKIHFRFTNHLTKIIPTIHFR